MAPEDRERAARIAAQSFHLSTPTAAGIDYYQPEQWVVVEDKRGVQAALQVLDAEQYFGGNAVAVAHVHALMVSAEARSRGYGKALLAHGISAMRDRGLPLSALVASVSAAYRNAGYEYAGSRVRYQMAIDQIPVDDPGLEIEPFAIEDIEEVSACYRRVVSGHNGPVVRSDRWWREHVLRRHKRELLHCYLVRDATEEVRGYIVYTHETDHGRFDPEFVADDIGYPYRVVARDFVWETVDAARALLTMVARHFAVGTDFVWLGPTDEPLALLVPRRDLKVANRSPWMARVVDVEGALLARGYPAWANGSVDLVVQDVFAGATRVRLTVVDGTPHVEPGTGDGMRLDVGALAAMYTSWLAPREVVRVGRLTNASVDDVTTLECLFSGRSPWTFDLF